MAGLGGLLMSQIQPEGEGPLASQQVGAARLLNTRSKRRAGPRENPLLKIAFVSCQKTMTEKSYLSGKS